ncbi:MAG TPA: hypothetical protein VHQ90_25080 [Thermoanaerobaculia bacterium]|nr:hypothetical protein [Thermoanaerobaculia bacterium]
MKKNSAPATEAELIQGTELSFDTQNPRLVEHGDPQSQKDILHILWREFSVDEIALSIAANGYFPFEPLFAAKEGGRLVVIEGNRRLAAVRLLLDSKLRQDVGATDLPSISAAAAKHLQRLPVVICSRDDIWQYVGFKHVNGPQQWQSYSKARYAAWVHNELSVSLDEIARRVGDQHSTVQRLYRAWMVVEEAEKAGVFSRDDRTKRHFSFSHLYTGLDYPGIQRFIGLSREKSFDTRSPVPKNKLLELGELCEWLYGSKSKQKKPVVESQNPDLRILDEVLQTKNGIAALRHGLPLLVARDIGKGDEQLFREALVAAKQSLQEARGRFLTGYQGEVDLLQTASEILLLARDLHGEMTEFQKQPPPRRQRAT